MAAISDEEMESLLSSFNVIYDDCKDAVKEMESLKRGCNAEIKKREALELSCESLKQDNDRIRKIYLESINKLGDQLEQRVSCQSLREELNRVKDESLVKEAEHRSTIELLREDYEAKVGDFKNQIRSFQLQEEAKEETISHLHQDLTAHKNHIKALAGRLDRVHSDMGTQYHHEIQDLKDCLMVEQEEKNELTKKFQDLERQLLMSTAKQVEQQKGFSSSQNVEMLKQKIMKLRKENEILKRQVRRDG